MNVWAFSSSGPIPHPTSHNSGKHNYSIQFLLSSGKTKLCDLQCHGCEPGAESPILHVLTIRTQVNLTGVEPGIVVKGGSAREMLASGVSDMGKLWCAWQVAVVGNVLCIPK